MKPDDINSLIRILQSSHNTVVVTGAGISTEAGIPDFRGKDGIYTKMGGEDKVMALINIDAFRKTPERFYDFHWQRFSYPPIEPSKAHKVLAKMEEDDLIKGIVTQNIDGLHQKAGGKNVVPIHGNSNEYVCTSCNKIHEREYAITFKPGVPACAVCGSILKPNVVLFGESINNYSEAAGLIDHAECLLVIGTSLTVYPLAGLVQDFSAGARNLVIINKGPTQLDHVALLKVEVDDGNTLGDILDMTYQGLTGPSSVTA
ncbi:MAG: Sir2 family NAD-dependent protein deacetylase [Syntrophomonadaceae bacterium]|nr:Sir2 family NAD-dependent protein deacetylase [Syntrophomonadaceae bacterium]